MTAIVGVLNKHGVAIAADSAVTFGNTHKVVHTGNKVFALSKFKPVSVATYGRLSFMGTPWDLIIKLYRQKLGRKSFSTIKEYVQDFIQYLHSKNFYADTLTQRRYLKENIQEFYDKVEAQAREEKSFSNDNAVKIIQSRLEECLSLNKISTNLCEELINYPFKDFYAFASNEIEEVINSKLYQLDAKQKALFAESYFYYLRQILDTQDTTGLVFSGYGESEIYPSLYSISISLGIDNRLRYYWRESAEINESGTVASVIPFAQIDVTQTIIRGINPSFYNVLATTFKDSMHGFAAQIAGLIEPINKDAANAILGLDTGKVATEFINKTSEQFRQGYTDPLLNTVVNLDKEDMSNMAESFVSLTSLVRRMSPMEETVGGPVDVVFISKGDGLIWMKRKHYFNPDLNAHFFANYYNDIEDDE